MQQQIGNQAIGRLISRRASTDNAPLPTHAGLDLAPLLAAQVPEMLPHLKADQIAAMQRRLDARASNQELDRRVAAKRVELSNRMIDDSGSEADRAGLAEVKGEAKSEDGPLTFEVPTAAILSDDILQEPAKNRTLEMAFRSWLHEEILKDPVVHVSVAVQYRGGAAMEADRRAHPDAEPATTENLAVLISGGRSLPHTRGKIHFADLVAHTFAREYDSQVTRSPAVVTLRNAIIDLEAQIGALKIEHADRIEKNHDHPVVRRFAEFLGGGPDMAAVAELLLDIQAHPEKGSWEERQEELSNDCPPLDIWDDPTSVAELAAATLHDGDFDIGALAYMKAEASLDRAARRYQRYESRVMAGAQLAVKWLNRAKFAGKIAATALPGSAVVNAALYSIVQEGSQQVAEIGQGERKGLDVAALGKGAAMEGAMAFFGGLTQSGFAQALEARVIEKYGIEAMENVGNKFIVGTTAAVAASPYNLAASTVLQKVIYGKAKLPGSVDELRDMLVEEAATSIAMEAGMQGVHHAFGESHPGAKTDGAEGDQGERPRGTTAPESAPGSEPTGAHPGAGEAAPGSGRPGAAEPAARKLELVELAESARTAPGVPAKLLDHFGTWDRTVGALREGAGEFATLAPESRATAVEALVGHRREVAQEVAQFGAEATGVDKPDATADLTVKGADAGLKVAQATEHLDASHPGWEQRYRMGVEVAAERAQSLADSVTSLPKPLREQLHQYQAEATEMLAAWREARGARTPELREAILGRIHGPEFRDWANKMLEVTPVDAAAMRIQHLAASDRAFAKIDRGAPSDTRYGQIKQAIDEQMLADALAPDLVSVTEPAADSANPASDEYGKHRGGDKAKDLVRPGSAAERLEARKIVDSMEQLGSAWPELPIPERLDALTTIANRALAARGIPNVNVVLPRGDLAAGTGGHFEFKTWNIVVDPTYVKAPTLKPELAAYMSGLGRHEGDHAIQWWEMARLRASQGDDAAAINARTKIDMDVAIQAVEVVKRDGPPSPAEAARAQTYWDSVYGEHKAARKYTLDERARLAKELDTVKAKIKALEVAGKQPDASDRVLREEVEDLFNAFDSMYKALPEEHASYTMDGVVKAESSLMQAERDLELAEVAVGHADEVLREVESRVVGEIAAERQPSPELLADHANLLDRVKRLEDAAAKIRIRRKMLEGYVQGGSPD